MTKIKTLSEKEVNNKTAQVAELKDMLAYLKAHLNISDKNTQHIAENMFNIASADTETDFTDSVKQAFHDYYVSNIALINEELGNDVMSGTSTRAEDHIYSQVHARYVLDVKANADPNNDWVEDNGYGKIIAVTPNTLIDMIEELI